MLWHLFGRQEGHPACKKIVCWFVDGDDLTGALHVLRLHCRHHVYHPYLQQNPKWTRSCYRLTQVHPENCRMNRREREQEWWNCCSILPIMAGFHLHWRQRDWAIHIILIFNFTRGMSYPNVLFVTQLESLDTRSNNLSRSFFHDICKPTSCLHHLIPPPRDTAVTTRLRLTTSLSRPNLRTKKYCSLINFGLHHYQPT